MERTEPWHNLIQTKTTSFGWTKAQLFVIEGGPGEVSHLFILVRKKKKQIQQVTDPGTMFPYCITLTEGAL